MRKTATSRHRVVSARLAALGILCFGLGACGPSDGGGGGTGGTASLSGGAGGSGGRHASGGMVGTGGSVVSGGVQGIPGGRGGNLTGGTTASTGVQGTGDTPVGGAGGNESGGTTAAAGASSGAGTGTGGAEGGNPGGGGSAGRGGTTQTGGSSGAGGKATGGTATGGSNAGGATDTAPTGDAGSSAGTLPPVTGVDTAGPFGTTQKLSSGPSSTSGLFYATELGKNGLKHPIFVWGCGGGSNPSMYAKMLAQIASHGFFVIAEVVAIGDNGAPLATCVDWASDENENAQSSFYQKLDTTKIALGGHSLGSANAFHVAADPRLTTTIHVAGGSLDEGKDINAPTTGQGGKRLVHPVAYICSENDTFGNVEKTEQDYANTTVPAFMTIMKGTDHGSAPQAGLAAITGWLRWHLGDETERRPMFLDAQGEFCTGVFVSKSKNW
ncbi:MAG: hypothetical protein JW940_07965 [Polyangiaceae bacterium]|nr:hypothetical protein [Polyangiaceae bacterium]